MSNRGLVSNQKIVSSSHKNEQIGLYIDQDIGQGKFSLLQAILCFPFLDSYTWNGHCAALGKYAHPRG